MADNRFETRVRRQAGAAIIDLIGEINSFTENVLNSAYTEAARDNPGPIFLNFSGVDYINSTGIALIVGLLAQARKSGRRLVTYGLSDHYREIFQITRLSDFMSIHPDEVNAAAENALMDAYTQASSMGARAILLNFGGLEYMNSSGIGLLVTLLIRAQRQKQRLLAYGLNEHYREIFTLTRLNEAIGIYRSEAEALAAA